MKVTIGIEIEDEGEIDPHTLIDRIRRALYNSISKEEDHVARDYDRSNMDLGLIFDVHNEVVATAYNKLIRAYAEDLSNIIAAMPCKVLASIAERSYDIRGARALHEGILKERVRDAELYRRGEKDPLPGDRHRATYTTNTDDVEPYEVANILTHLPLVDVPAKLFQVSISMVREIAKLYGLNSDERIHGDGGLISQITNAEKNDRLKSQDPQERKDIIEELIDGLPEDFDDWANGMTKDQLRAIANKPPYNLGLTESYSRDRIYMMLREADQAIQGDKTITDQVPIAIDTIQSAHIEAVTGLLCRLSYVTLKGVAVEYGIMEPSAFTSREQLEADIYGIEQERRNTAKSTKHWTRDVYPNPPKGLMGDVEQIKTMSIENVPGYLITCENNEIHWLAVHYGVPQPLNFELRRDLQDAIYTKEIARRRDAKDAASIPRAIDHIRTSGLETIGGELAALDDKMLKAVAAEYHIDDADRFHDRTDLEAEVLRAEIERREEATGK